MMRHLIQRLTVLLALGILLAAENAVASAAPTPLLRGADFLSSQAFANSSGLTPAQRKRLREQQEQGNQPPPPLNGAQVQPPAQGPGQNAIQIPQAPTPATPQNIPNAGNNGTPVVNPGPPPPVPPRNHPQLPAPPNLQPPPPQAPNAKPYMGKLPPPPSLVNANQNPRQALPPPPQLLNRPLPPLPNQANNAPPVLQAAPVNQNPVPPQNPNRLQPAVPPPINNPVPPPQDSGPRIKLNENSQLVYEKAIIQPFNANAPATIVYKGQLKFDPQGNVSLVEGGLLGSRPLGKFLAGGANSRVHKSNSDPKFVNKIVSLNSPGMTPVQVGSTITDQNGGRAILNDIKRAQPNSLYRVANQQWAQIVETTGPDGKTYRFVMSREENISSPVYRTDGSPITRNGQPVTATNAWKRIDMRKQPLSMAEELTINLVIRDLNQNGVVWTDHKLENLDIVPDSSSPTGFRVVFFDFDGFRPVYGKSRTARWEAARDIQRAFDNPAPSWGGVGGIRGRLREANRKHYPEEAKRQDKMNGSVDPFMAFDLTAFGDRNIGNLATVTANMDRPYYLYVNSMDPGNFSKEIEKFNKERNTNVPYNLIQTSKPFIQ